MSSSGPFTDCLELNNFMYVLSVQPNSIFCLDSATSGSWSFTHDCIRNIILNMTNGLVSQNVSFLWYISLLIVEDVCIYSKWVALRREKHLVTLLCPLLGPSPKIKEISSIFFQDKHKLSENILTFYCYYFYYYFMVISLIFHPSTHVVKFSLRPHNLFTDMFRLGIAWLFK